MPTFFFLYRFTDVSDHCDDDHGTEDEEQRPWINRRDGEASESRSGQVAAHCSQSGG